MNHTGHLKINRKDVPYHMMNNEVTLIPNDTYSSLMPSEIKEKETIAGVTTGNRDVIFIGCRYNKTSLGYKAMVYSSSNTGMYKDITRFDRICFVGKPVNVFTGPGRAFTSESGMDISERMKALKPKKWEEINFQTDTKVREKNIKISIDYYISYNLRYAETSMGDAIPRFIVEFDKPALVRNIPKLYLMVYDFFAFLNFGRNIKFEEIFIQNKIEGQYRTIAKVLINHVINEEEYNNTERNSIVLDDCKIFLGELFKIIALRRTQKIYDNLYIPNDKKEKSQISYEKFLSCALSFESEYSRTHSSKKEENEKYALVHNMAQGSADKIYVLFERAREGTITSDEFLKCYLGDFKVNYAGFLKNLSKTQVRSYNGYYKKITNELAKIDFSLSEKYKNALQENKEMLNEIINRLSKMNKVDFPSDSSAGELFAGFRNQIAHGNPPEIKSIHGVLFEVARTLIYIMVLKKAGADKQTIKMLVEKIFG